MSNFFRAIFSGDHLWELVEQQATVVHQGAVAFSALTITGATPDAAVDRVDRSEAEGAKVSLAIETALRSTLFSPIDREDMYELSSALDNVLALIAHASRAFLMLGDAPSGASESSPDGSRLEELLVGCTKKIHEAIGYFRVRDYNKVVDASRELRGLHKTAERVHDEALSSLFREDDSLDSHALIRKKAPLDNAVETVGECGAVGKLLAYLAVKNS